MYETQLRVALSAGAQAKQASRSAGEGMWANYVRATCYPQAPSSVEAMDAEHKALVERLNQIGELSKDEKNSLRSAKSVISKAIANGRDVWQRDADGVIVINEAGDPMPKGKTELQDEKTDIQKLVAFLEGFEKTFSRDGRDPLTVADLELLKGKFLTVSAAVGEEYSRAVA